MSLKTGRVKYMVFEIEFTAGTDLSKAVERLWDEVHKRKETGYIRFNGCTILICHDCREWKEGEKE